MNRNHLLVVLLAAAAPLALAAPGRAAAQDAAPPLQENPHSARFKDPLHCIRLLIGIQPATQAKQMNVLFKVD